MTVDVILHRFNTFFVAMRGESNIKDPYSPGIILASNFDRFRHIFKFKILISSDFWAYKINKVFNVAMMS